MTAAHAFCVRDALPQDQAALGRLTAEVYAGLPGMPSPAEQPDYYAMLRDVASRVTHPCIRNIIAEGNGALLGGATFVGDMAHYGSGGTATREPNAAGMRLLVVAPEARKQGLGRALTLECIRRARSLDRATMVLHTTRAMMGAWAMYEGMGFRRAEDLDFLQKDLPVFGFRLAL